MRMGLEMIVLPVDDVDRSKAFYEQVGFTCDVDHVGDEMRVVQFTPPGSNCSIVVGYGMGPVTESPVLGIHLTVADLDATVADLRQRGVEVDDPYHFGPDGKASGTDPAHTDYASYSSFRDPDGNTWVLQEVRSRAE